MQKLEPTDPRAHQRLHLLTVAVEDYFQATAVNPLIPERHRARMESRVVDNTVATLELLARHRQRATFFVHGPVAEAHPELVRRIYDEGHEVACKGYQHAPLSQHTRESFRASALRSKQGVERALGRRCLGFRLAEGDLSESELWALEELSALGFVYDSSAYPRLWTSMKHRFPFEHDTSHGTIREFPLATLGYAALALPMAGGNYFRQLPESVPRFAFELWERRYASPFNMYFHVWELDEELPRIATAKTVTKLRQYRNLEQMPRILGHYLEKYRFTSLADFQRLEQESLTDEVPPLPSQRVDALSASESGEVEALTIVIPCFNESQVLGYLKSALDEVSATFAPRYDVNFLLVDDCSTDDTWDLMQGRFQDDRRFTLVKHDVNQGVAGAVMTGIRAAKTELVCSMDADCTYDPGQLAELLERLEPDIAMVTASPYHREGHVVGVPEWRLFLSRNLSRLYGQLLRHEFATYTACFRAYRKSLVEHIQLENGGFLGVAEMLVRLDIEGKKIRECPATLEVRLLGVSKMKTARTIREHLRLLSRIPGLKRQLFQTASSTTAA